MRNNGVKVINNIVFFRSKDSFKILVIKLDHLGDLLLSIPALCLLRQKFPNSYIDIVVGHWNKNLAEKIGFFKNIFVFDFFREKSEEAAKENFMTNKTFFENLGEYDIAIDLRRPRDTRIFLTYVKAKLKVGYKTFSKIDEKLDICLPTDIDEPHKIKPCNKTHISIQLLRLVEAIPYYTFYLPNITSNIRSISIQSSKKIALFPGAGNAIKQWPLDYWKKLTENLIQCGFEIEVFLANSERNYGKLFQDKPRTKIYIGLDVESLIKKLSCCLLTIANNSFGAHISSFIDLPVVAIFGGHELYSEWAPPFNKSVIVYSDVSCAPCHLPRIKDCPYDLICLRQIQPDFVCNVVLNLLQNIPQINTVNCIGAVF
ncbi:glycosyltransferase family 9 protein [Desulfonauticus submarinus]